MFEVSKASIIETVAMSRKSNEYALYSKCVVTLLDDNGKATDEQYKVTLENSGWNVKKIGSAMVFSDIELSEAVGDCLDAMGDAAKRMADYDAFESGKDIQQITWDDVETNSDYLSSRYDAMDSRDDFDEFMHEYRANRADYEFAGSFYSRDMSEGRSLGDILQDAMTRHAV